MVVWSPQTTVPPAFGGPSQIWTKTPVKVDAIGRVARASQPYIQQLFVRRGPGMDEMTLERKLYVVRRRAEKRFPPALAVCWRAERVVGEGVSQGAVEGRGERERAQSFSPPKRLSFFGE